MVANIQKVAQTAYKIFSRLYGSGELQIGSENVRLLSSMMNNVKKSDVNFDMTKVPKYMDADDEAPVSYIGIFEDPVMTMAIFVIRDGYKIPLHDHPGMYGFCKVIHGSAWLQSYSNPPKNFDSQPPEEITRQLKPMFKNTLKPVSLENDIVVSSDDDCCVLTPDSGTYHELTAHNGPVAFLDILAPSYDHSTTGQRICQYYKEIGQKSHQTRHQGKQIKWLLPISPPDEFWCDHTDYDGPSILDALKGFEVE